jgi:hypothetical protein
MGSPAPIEPSEEPLPGAAEEIVDTALEDPPVGSEAEAQSTCGEEGSDLEACSFAPCPDDGCPDGDLSPAQTSLDIPTVPTALMGATEARLQ